MKSPQGTLALAPDVTLEPRAARDYREMFEVVERYRTVLREWLPWVDATRTPADALSYARFAERQAVAGFAFDYAVRAHGRIVGAIGLHHVEWPDALAHLGYWLVPDARGRGLATRAVAALERRAFDWLGMHRLEIRCVLENVRSRAVAERSGYRFEGTLREAYALHGRFADLALYAKLAGD
ncbi:MAG: GNAT family protein [Candidatus Baltobacteraceae bacterium]